MSLQKRTNHQKKIKIPPAPNTKKKAETVSIAGKIAASKLSYLIIFALSFTVYFQTLFFGFTDLDDKKIILEHHDILSDFSNINVIFERDAFLSTEGKQFYRPLQSFSYMLDSQIGGESPWIYHLTNITINSLVCCAAFYLFVLLGIKKVVSFLSTALFSIHPLFVHAVAWAPARGDLLIALFGILSFIFLIKYIKSNKVYYILLHAITFLFSVFSKENAILFPLLFVFYLNIINKKKLTVNFQVTLIISYIIIAAIFLAARMSVVKIQLIDEVFGFTALLKNLQVLPEIIFKFFIPVHLSTMPAFNTYLTLGGIFAMILLAVTIILIKNKRTAYIIFGLLWLLIFILPSMLYRHGDADLTFDYFDHRAYLPMLGLLFTIAELLNAKAIKTAAINKISASAAFISFILIVLTLSHSRNYTETAAFYNKALSLEPKNFLAYYNLGVYYQEKGDFNKAIEDYSNSLKYKPSFEKAWNNRGLIYGRTGQFDMALNDFNKAIYCNPKYYDAYSNRGNCRHYFKDIEGACSDWNFAAKNGSKSAADMLKRFCK